MFYYDLASMKNRIVVFIALSLSLATRTFGQPGLPDSLQPAAKNAADIYYKAIGENNHLYNGSEYVAFPYTAEKNPFFKSVIVANGSINYDGTLYNEVPLVYDIFRDEVITNRYKENYRIKLVNEKIGYFFLSGHEFIRIVKDSNNSTVPETGFYDRLYNGKVTALSRRVKKMGDTVTSSGTVTHYFEADQYFIKKEGIYYPVHNKKTTLSVFRDRKKDVQKLLRKNKIKFKQDHEAWIVKAAEYYDQLKN